MIKTFDKEFKKIKGLKYLPWIGNDYLNSKTKLLVLGESNYKSKNCTWEMVKLPNWNRMLVKDHFAKIKKDYDYYKLLKNFSKALNIDITNNGYFNFAQKITFINIVQKPLKNENYRPNKYDYIYGWEIISKIIQIIKPKNIIIIGVSSIKYLLNNTEIILPLEIKNIKVGNKINRIYPIKFKLKMDKEIINCISIRHTSKYFSPDLWHNYIKNNINLKELL